MYLTILTTSCGVCGGYIYGKRKDDIEFIKQTFPNKYMHALFLGFYGFMLGATYEYTM